MIGNHIDSGGKHHEFQQKHQMYRGELPKSHANTADYCSLDCITVGTHEANPTMDQCTDCLSFKKK